MSSPSVDKEIKTVDEENNVDITTQAGKEIEDEEVDKTNEIYVGEDRVNRHFMGDFQLSDTGKKLIVPTMDIPDRESLDLEILQVVKMMKMMTIIMMMIMK